MKKIFTFLFISLFSVSLFAADIIVTTVQDDTGTDVTPPAGSLREAIGLAQSGDVIKFNTTDGGTIELKNTISIVGAGKVLVIDGLNAADGKPIILTKASDAPAGARVLQIANSSGNANLDVTIRNVSFENSNSTSNGAVITSGNSAYTSPSFKVTMENCQFKNNESKIGSGSSSGGAGVYFVSHGTDVTFKNCLFVNNKLSFSDKETEDAAKSIGGGCISTTGNGTAKITAINSTFANNSTLARGGAIFSGHPLYLVNCTFTGNHGTRGGGVYFHNDNEIVIVNSLLTHNTSTDNTDRSDLHRNPGTPTKNNQFGYMIVGLTNYTMEGMSFVDLFPTELPPLYAALDAYGKPALGANGGLFESVALSNNSAARNKATANEFQGLAIPTTDQRGYTRTATPSIGAFEYGGLPSSINKITNGEGKIYAIGNQIVFSNGLKGFANVYSLSGACVLQSQVESTIKTNLPKGIYVVKLVESNSATTLVSKIIIN